MIRIVLTILALVMLVSAIKAYYNDRRASVTERVCTFFLLVISLILTAFVASDVYLTLELLLEYVLSLFGAVEAPVYPGTAHIYGIWVYKLWYVLLLGALCSLTIAGIALRKRIPGIFETDKE